MKNTIAVLTFTIAALVAPSSSSAHGLGCHARMSAPVLERCQARSLAHAEGAVRFLEKRSRTAHGLDERSRTALREHRARARMLRRELADTRARHNRARAVPYPWSALGDCETTGPGDGQVAWSYNGSSGFDGGLQFHPRTWSAYRRAGEPRYAYDASPRVQVRVAKRVLAEQGWSAWPACSRSLRLR